MAKITFHLSDELLFRLDLRVDQEQQAGPRSRSRLIVRALERELGVTPSAERRPVAPAAVSVAGALEAARCRASRSRPPT